MYTCPACGEQHETKPDICEHCGADLSDAVGYKDEQDVTSGINEEKLTDEFSNIASALWHSILTAIAGARDLIWPLICKDPFLMTVFIIATALTVWFIMRFLASSF